MSLQTEDTVSVLGVSFNNVTAQQALEKIEELIALGGSHQVATANTDFIANAQQDREVKRILRDCSLVLPDGMPVVWAARMLGMPLKERVTGIDLIPMLAAASAEKGYRIYLLGSTDKVLQRATARLRQMYPDVQIVGCHAPAPAPLEDMDHEGILAGIEAAAPDILLVALGHPKQERWLHLHRTRLRVPVTIGIGGSLDVLAGEFNRAPRWMQKCGFEWLFRAIQEPSRLMPRYYRDAKMLVNNMPGELVANRYDPVVATVYARRQVGRLRPIAARK